MHVMSVRVPSRDPVVAERLSMTYVIVRAREVSEVARVCSRKSCFLPRRNNSDVARTLKDGCAKTVFLTYHALGFSAIRFFMPSSITVLNKSSFPVAQPI